MKYFSHMVLCASLILASLNAIAADPAEALAQKSGCLNCHGISNKILGPAYKDVAAKYKGDKTAARLITKVKVGGSGAWGSMPMPANSPQVKDDDIKTIVKWVLSL
jgi:cytochrome c